MLVLISIMMPNTYCARKILAHYLAALNKSFEEGAKSRDSQ